jgi:gluconolactonase
MKVCPDGSLIDREIFGPKDLGGLLDGIAFDADGNLWGTLVHSEIIFVLTPEGHMKTIYDDGDKELRDQIDKAFFEGSPYLL